MGVDDWKGENLIPAKASVKAKRRELSLSAACSIAAERKRREGTNPSVSNGMWARQFKFFWKCGGPRG